MTELASTLSEADKLKGEVALFQGFIKDKLNREKDFLRSRSETEIRDRTVVFANPLIPNLIDRYLCIDLKGNWCCEDKVLPNQDIKSVLGYYATLTDLDLTASYVNLWHHTQEVEKFSAEDKKMGESMLKQEQLLFATQVEDLVAANEVKLLEDLRKTMFLVYSKKLISF